MKDKIVLIGDVREVKPGKWEVWTGEKGWQRTTHAEVLTADREGRAVRVVSFEESAYAQGCIAVDGKMIPSPGATLDMLGRYRAGGGKYKDSTGTERARGPRVKIYDEAPGVTAADFDIEAKPNNAIIASLGFSAEAAAGQSVLKGQMVEEVPRKDSRVGAWVAWAAIKALQWAARRLSINQFRAVKDALEKIPPPVPWVKPWAGKHVNGRCQEMPLENPADKGLGPGAHPPEDEWGG